MEIVSTLTLVALAIVFFFGQLFRLTVFHLEFPLLDLLIVLLAVCNTCYHLSRHPKVKNKWFLFFILFSALSLFLNIFFNRRLPLKPLFYFLRLSSLLSFLIFPLQIKNRRIISFFNLAIIANLIFGLIQYLFWPDFTYFSALNWDPHLNRIVSTFFDPTFTALLYLLFLLYIYLQTKPSLIKYLLLTLCYSCLALTYSRSSLLAFLVAFLYISCQTKNFKKFFFSLLIVILTVIFLPKPPGEGTKLDRTASIRAKIVNYKEGIALYLKSPFIGVGYNTLEQVRSVAPASHAANGFDGSLLTILITTGLIGFVLFIKGLTTHLFANTWTQNVYWLVVLFHSFFANSLLYPWILFYLIFMVQIPASPQKS